MTKKLQAIILTLVVAGLMVDIGMYSITHHTQAESPISSVSNIHITPITSKTNSTTNNPTRTSNVIIYFDNYGFDPNIATIPVGTLVTFKNISTKGSLTLAQVDWTGRFIYNTSLDLGVINEGQSKSFTINEDGVWQYEGNHNPSLRGEIAGGSTLSIQPYMYPNSTVTTSSLNMQYNAYGFMPNEISVPAGTTIKLTNDVDKSQPGPSLFQESPADVIKNSELNIGLLQKKQSKSFVINTPGTYLLEDAYQPSAKGLAQITVN